jgi:ADP-ribose pyrophosphatase
METATGQVGFENSRVRFLEDVVVQPDGSVGSYTVIEERLGAAAVVALTDDDRIVLVRQHRYPIDAATLEVPAGAVPVGGDPIEHGRRELAEETGIVARHLRVIGRFAPSPARVRRYCDVVVADQLSWSQLGPMSQDRDEAIREVGLYTADAVRAAIGSGAIFDGPTLSALAISWALIDAESSIAGDAVNGEKRRPGRNLERGRPRHRG